MLYISYEYRFVLIVDVSKAHADFLLLRRHMWYPTQDLVVFALSDNTLDR